MTNIFFIKGNFIKETEASLSIQDLGFLRGYGVYDCFRTYNRIPFCLDLYIDRFILSSKAMLLDSPYSKNELRSIIDQLIDKNPTEELIFKLILTGGDSTHILPQDKPALYIFVSHVKSSSEQPKPLGINLITSNHLRSNHKVKSLQYANAIIALKEAKKANANDALYCNNNNHLLEITTGNFFAVKNKCLFTPKDEILPGIIRNSILELAHSLKITTKEGPIHYDDIQSFDEVFITSSLKEITPVNKINQHVYSKNRPTTQILQKEFNNLTQNLLLHA